MSITKRKVLFAWQEEKERLWLEEQALEGYKLTGVGIFRYTFDEIEPKALSYQFDFNVISQDELGSYYQLYEDAGFEHITTFGSWHYFCCEKSKTSQNDIFNDNTSKMEKYKRLLLFLCLTAIPMYLQAFIVAPASLLEGTMSEFYKYFSFVLYPLVIIHIYAMSSIGSYYLKLKKQIKQ